MAENRTGLARLLAQVLEDLGAVAAGHADLARRELRSDLAAARRNLALHLAGVLLLSAGLVLIFFGVSVWAGEVLGSPVRGLFVVGGVLVLVGGGMAGSARRLLFRRSYLARSRRELVESGRWLQEDILPRLSRDRS